MVKSYKYNEYAVLEDVKGSGYSMTPEGKAAADRPDDLARVKLAKKGDRKAFESLFHKYRERIYHVTFKYVWNREDALDVVQESFMKAYQALDSFKEDSNFYTWLCRIAINKAIDHIRSRRTKKAVSFDALAGEDEAMPAFEGSPDDAPLNRARLAELKIAVAGAIEKLPDYHRDVIVLNAEKDLSYKEIAATLGISVGTVMSRLFYARQALKEMLGQYLE